MTLDANLDRDVRLFVYRFFLEAGRPPVPAETVAALGSTSALVEASLRRLGDDHALVLAPGTPYVWMANPLSALPTPFQVEADGRTWFGNCIWDALGIPAILKADGLVRSWCADCAAPMALEVSDGRLQRGVGVLHFAVPAASWWDDIGHT
ncbi:MAG: hypothetical protein H0W27_00180 [Actinobacteria bacterium]|nr:hypothetical protein [Actinomycetota bacterium]